MAINFNNALGIHEHAMQLRIKRSEILATNLANTDTPNFKARDIDFRSLLENQEGEGVVRPRLQGTHDNHIAPNNLTPQIDLKYRTPLQPSLDGNTVDEQAELSRFAKNSMDFQASFQFLNGAFSGMKKALTGDIR